MLRMLDNTFFFPWHGSKTKLKAEVFAGDATKNVILSTMWPLLKLIYITIVTMEITSPDQVAAISDRG